MKTHKKRNNNNNKKKTIKKKVKKCLFGGDESKDHYKNDQNFKIGENAKNIFNNLMNNADDKNIIYDTVNWDHWKKIYDTKTNTDNAKTEYDKFVKERSDRAIFAKTIVDAFESEETYAKIQKYFINPSPEYVTKLTEKYNKNPKELYVFLMNTIKKPNINEDELNGWNRLTKEIQKVDKKATNYYNNFNTYKSTVDTEIDKLETKITKLIELINNYQNIINNNNNNIINSSSDNEEKKNLSQENILYEKNIKIAIKQIKDIYNMLNGYDTTLNNSSKKLNDDLSTINNSLDKLIEKITPDPIPNTNTGGKLKRRTRKKIKAKKRETIKKL
jgi:hypothetical protein